MNKYESILERSRTRHRDIIKKMRYLSRFKKPHFDATVHRFHDEVFREIDCRDCGLCCRNMGPVFRKTDIKQICSYTGSREKDFISRYLVQDPDGVGYMLKELPCPFQASDNTCEIYECRTLSCVNFPHTRSVAMQKKLTGLALDSRYCPAAFLICEKIIQQYL